MLIEQQSTLLYLLTSLRYWFLTSSDQATGKTTVTGLLVAVHMKIAFPLNRE